jgi:steroid delta-isomerase-like uncharacterized protein
MRMLELADRYFDAWNRHDAAGILAALGAEGTYSDPVAGRGLTGDAVASYAKGLWEAFPDLSFELVSVAAAGADTVAAQWRMRGTNTGSFRGLPPTGRAIALDGADFVRIQGDMIRSVQGYFDSRAVPEQLGLDVVVQPKTAGPFAFGISTSVQSGNRAKPGAFGITALQIRSPEEQRKVRELSRGIAGEMLRMPGFIGWTGMTIGERMLTVTAWETPDGPRQLMRGGLHESGATLLLAGDRRRRLDQRVGPGPHQRAVGPLLELRPHGRRQRRCAHLPLRCLPARACALLVTNLLADALPDRGEGSCVEPVQVSRAAGPAHLNPAPAGTAAHRPESSGPAACATSRYGPPSKNPRARRASPP